MDEAPADSPAPDPVAREPLSGAPVSVRRAEPLPDAPPQDHHRNVGGGAARAAVFGFGDGLLTNVLLILGVAGANPQGGFVRLAGVAGLIAGAFSMASGEFSSMTAQVELIEREVAIEREELRNHPESEKRELVNLYVGRGLDLAAAQQLAGLLHINPEVALDVHIREELGVTLNGLGSPAAAAGSSLISFAVGAFVPLFPWFFTNGNRAVAISVLLAALVSLAIGTALAYFTGRSKLFSAFRQLIFAMVPAGFAFGIGRLVGVTTS